MSQELEMLRSMVAVDHLRGGEKFEVPKTAGQASWVWRMTHLDLRAILARLEAAERVCESCEEGKAPWSGNYEMMYDKDALSAYRALAPKEHQ